MVKKKIVKSADKRVKEKKEYIFDIDAIISKIAKQMEVLDPNLSFPVDPLQEVLIQRYCQKDQTFATALYTDYTAHFLRFLLQKAYKNEPVSISIMGMQRGGKSYAAMTLHAIMMLLRGKLPDAKWIVADKNEYLRMLRLPPEQVKAICFVVDEDKTAVFGTGSIARKAKLLDVQNIIAVNAISVIWIRPDEFSFSDAQYGLRVFGRYEGKFKERPDWFESCEKMYKDYCKKGGSMSAEDFSDIQKKNPIISRISFKEYADGELSHDEFLFVEGERRDPGTLRLTRFMLYNLQESSSGGGLPLGMVYLPPFVDMPELFPSVDGSFVEHFEKTYMDRKMDWVHKEQSGSRDSLYKDKMRIANKFAKDVKFNELKSMPDKILYVSVQLGTEYTKNDCEEICRIGKKIVEGFWTEADVKRLIGSDPDE